MAECKSCRKPIYWVVTVNNKKMPIDAVGSPAGTIVLVAAFKPTDPAADREGKVRVAEVHNERDPRHAGLQRYIAHFATCPSAKVHRKAKARR